MNAMSALLACAALLPLAPSARAAPVQEARPGQEMRKVAILVYPGVELLDFSGPGEVFSSARGSGGHAFEVFTVWKEKAPVVSQGFLSVVPAHDFADAPRPDVVVLPGGNVPADDPEVVAWVQGMAKEADVLMSVCNGAYLLAAAGLLDGLEVTTHRSALLGVQKRVPSARVLVNRRWVDHGSLVTTAGVSAGIDGALQVVSRLVSQEAATATARYMEYDWRPEEIARLHETPGITPEGLVGRFLEISHEEGLEKAVAAYRSQLAEPDTGLARSGVRPGELNAAGYARLSAGRTAEALEIFRFAVAAHPTSANFRDSLADALEAAGEKEAALEATHEALELAQADPALTPAFRQQMVASAEARLARLESGQGATEYACPPCGGGCDAARHEAPGICPGCGMTMTAVAAR